MRRAILNEEEGNTMRTVASGDVRPRETVRKGGVGRRVDYLGSPGTIDADPQAFLVERLYEGARIEPHFHDVDQFQVVVEGDCRMGKKTARPITFQYADAYTPYGPIVGAERGFAFFTLRPVSSGGFFPMPGNKHKMPGRAGRNIAGVFDTDAPPPAAAEVTREDLMAAQADGVFAVAFRLGPDAEADGLPSDGGGQYYLVCEGALIGGETNLPRRSLIHIEPGESLTTLRAGPDGADVLALQFCRPSERPGSDPKALAARDPDAYVERPQISGS
jgi:hypothetical protein